MIERGEILTLDDGEQYILSSMVDINQKKYVYLIGKEDCHKYIIGEYVDEDIVEVEDPDLLESLLAKFNEDLKESLPNIISEYL